MKTRSAAKAMLAGGGVSFGVFLVVLVLAALFRAIEESFIGAMIWGFPVPMEFLEKVTDALFGSHTDERGLVVVLAAVGIEVTLLGAALGCVIHVSRSIAHHRR